MFARSILGLKTKDITAGVRCYSVNTLNQIDVDKNSSSGYAFQEEMIYRCEKKGFKIKEIPISFVDRKYGRSKLGIGDILEFFVTIFRLKSIKS